MWKGKSVIYYLERQAEELVNCGDEMYVCRLLELQSCVACYLGEEECLCVMKWNAEVMIYGDSEMVFGILWRR